MRIHDRGEFDGRELRRHHVHHDPLRHLRVWLREAEELPEDDPHAMTLSTVTTTGLPSSRIVSLKRIDEAGPVFTSSSSRKTIELGHQPIAALVLYWPRLQRQVRLRGPARRLPTDQNLELFEGRTRDQRLALHGLPQGRPVPSREAITEHHDDLGRRMNDPVPMPPSWGGWRVAPDEIEFWQGREKRLHDRIRCRKVDAGTWSVTRLAP